MLTGRVHKATWLMDEEHCKVRHNVHSGIGLIGNSHVVVWNGLLG